MVKAAVPGAGIQLPASVSTILGDPLTSLLRHCMHTRYINRRADQTPKHVKERCLPGLNKCHERTELRKYFLNELQRLAVVWEIDPGVEAVGTSV